MPECPATPIPPATPTITPLTGPLVTAFGVADSSGTFNAPVDTDTAGRPVYLKQTAAGFIIFVEGRVGPSRLPVGTNLFKFHASDPTSQPDLQIESSRDLGNGSRAVCDKATPVLGGVPATDPPDFSPTQPITDALNDFGCRFKAFTEGDFACTQDSSGNFVFSNASSTTQFCTLVDDASAFPSGDTVITARLKDTAGRAGPAAQIVVRIGR